jgi:hypothetical protein
MPGYTGKTTRKTTGYLYCRSAAEPSQFAAKYFGSDRFKALVINCEPLSDDVLFCDRLWVVARIGHFKNSEVFEEQPE